MSVEFEMTVFGDLIGRTIREIERKLDDELVFHMEDGPDWRMYHSQHCCESVTIEDIVGDLTDLIGSSLIDASERVQTPDVSKYGDSETWTFYRFSTNKGTVVIRWIGSSNGYYSESVDFKPVSTLASA